MDNGTAMSNDTAGGGGHHSSGVSVTSAVTAAGDVVSGAGDSSQDQGIPTGAAESSAVSGGECSSAEAEASPNVQKLLDILADPDVVRLIAAALPKLLETVARKGSQQGLRAIDAKHGLSAAPDTDSINAKASAARSTQVANWKLKQECRDIDAKYERERFAVASWWVRKELRCELRAIDRKYGLRKELSAIDINRKAYTALCARIASWQLKQELRAIDEKYRARIELQAELREIDEKYKREVDLQRALRAAEIAWQAREELRRELRAIDARTELYQELRAIDEKYKSRVELQAELRAIDAKYGLSAPDADSINHQATIHRAAEVASWQLKQECRDIDAKCRISQLVQESSKLSSVVAGLADAIGQIDHYYPPGTEEAMKLFSDMLRDIDTVCNVAGTLSTKIKEIAAPSPTLPDAAYEAEMPQAERGTINYIASDAIGIAWNACLSLRGAGPSATLDDILFAPAQQAQGAAL
ncbi:hypothetical protein [Anaplasma marginale]|uniref:hypothetical protein n=1 Tax=Anaplasma marginale TaxID=770 RepID=UPI0011EC9741|nr:hypothetical protein [Anaplasma marginale]KAA8473072.1 hypothetical protein F0Q58_00190 [Anaplasma marginale]KAB0451431.1 hypothetical protein FY210_00190 [Anaplasma marginale]TZF79300.1 hypothetical protein FY180_00750 [Anaplasma marginale]